MTRVLRYRCRNADDGCDVVCLPGSDWLLKHITVCPVKALEFNCPRTDCNAKLSLDPLLAHIKSVKIILVPIPKCLVYRIFNVFIRPILKLWLITSENIPSRCTLAKWLILTKAVTSWFNNDGIFNIKVAVQLPAAKVFVAVIAVTGLHELLGKSSYFSWQNELQN